jgi:hypothetical protein
MAALALALESELAPAAALQLSRALKIVRHSSKFSPPQRAAAKMHVARLGWALVMEARKEKGGTTASSNLREGSKLNFRFECKFILVFRTGTPKFIWKGIGSAL